MKIAYVTTYDTSDIHAWSGINYRMLQMLRDLGHQVETIDNLGTSMANVYKVKTLMYRMLARKTYLRDREPSIQRGYARKITTAMRDIDVDLIFAPSTRPIPYLDTTLPIVVWTDATFAGMVDYYADFSNLCRESLRNGNRGEQRALSQASLLIYSSEWAAQTAMTNYDVDPAKFRVIPFGANVDQTCSRVEMENRIAARAVKPWKLLFVGVDWRRKGGDIAVQMAQQMTERGYPTELHVVGCTPPALMPDFVVTHGFLSKTSAEGRARLEQIFTESHLFVLPSRADCTPVVLAEANSFGLPVLSTDVGGISTVVIDGKNGYLFALDAPPESYARAASRLLESPATYTAFARSSYDQYVERLNWSVAGEQVDALLKVVAGQSGRKDVAK